MCGIAGIIKRDPLQAQDLAALARSNKAQVHRGPDGEGWLQADHVALAMRRLSIIDLSGGWQPLYNEDRELALVANGEIYNFVELRADLERRGHRFATGSDCETILHLYEEYGADCVSNLRGMFAFALWDSRKQQVLLARDRMGEKPLYLYEQAGMLLFTSELRAMLASGRVHFELDPVAVDWYFHYQYVPEPLTPVVGVRKLPAAHWLMIDLASWQVREHCYWQMEDAPPLEGDPAGLIAAELDSISKLVLRSDVPVGVALSSGLDSSAVAALAARDYPGTIHAFSIGYAGRPACDERAEAAAFAAHLNIPFHDVEIATSDVVRLFPEVVYWRDDPIADISGHGYYAVMKLAREHGVPVVLQGQGGDELFWGYDWLQQALRENRQKLRWQRYGYLAAPQYLEFKLSDNLRPGQILLWFRNACGARSGWQRWQRQRNAPPDQMVFYDTGYHFGEALKHSSSIYSQCFVEHLAGHSATDLFRFAQPWPPSDLRLTRLVCDTYLRENGIAQGDRLSMASAIELRLPLVDYRLVETVIGLRKTRSDQRLPPKAWLRAALRNVLPDWIMQRPKRGFIPPIMEWKKAIGAGYGSALLGGYLVNAGILDARGPLMRQALEPGAEPVPLYWEALVLEQWCRQMQSLAQSAREQAVQVTV